MNTRNKRKCIESHAKTLYLLSKNVQYWDIWRKKSIIDKFENASKTTQKHKAQIFFKKIDNQPISVSLINVTFWITVIILCASPDTVREIMLSARDLKMTDGNYVFINIDVSTGYASDLWSLDLFYFGVWCPTYCWKKQLIVEKRNCGVRIFEIRRQICV